MMVMPFLPETPSWLVHNGKIAQAEKVSLVHLLIKSKYRIDNTSVSS
jgi:hypothetical protein